MESLITLLIFLVLLLLVGVPYWRRTILHRKQAEEAREKNVKVGLHEPVTLHPRIDVMTCIGCGSCVRACPEDVLGIVDGRAAVVHGARCIGHSLCADACPVNGITMTFGTPKQGMEIPFYDENFMTNIAGLYIVGELGGVGLIRNAFEQAKKAIEHIATSNTPSLQNSNTTFDVAIIGAGPAGISAALSAKEKELTHIVLEQDDFGGSVLHYPRQKLVLTSPVELPLYGKLKYSEISKEDLLVLFNSLIKNHELNIQPKQKVEAITKEETFFTVRTSTQTITARNVVLALGRRGSPRKLGVPGEQLPKVYYKLIEAESYNNKHLLVVGGGDSAVEAAIGLARQKGNTVTLSYRRESFVRLKEKNEQRIQEMIHAGKIHALFNSEVMEITSESAIIKEQSNLIHNIKNDVVFIFAGGELPAEFLKKIGVQLRTKESTILAA
ncbi:MAG: NAD(P)-binding domain-containing protein [Ignavibacteriae bacterium]|nr:NAD(P)-binding domain-containing protein [Ignavibacteriota bacterium]